MSNQSNIRLTEKEKLVIEYKARGLTTSQIALRLATSTRYAHQIVHDLYQKTGARNGAALIAWAYQHGILQINAENLPSSALNAE